MREKDRGIEDGSTPVGIYRVLPRLTGVSGDYRSLREGTRGECRPRQEPRQGMPSHDSSHGG